MRDRSNLQRRAIAPDGQFGLLEHSMGYLVRQAFAAFTGRFEKYLEPHGISLSMWFFLRTLRERDGATQKELSDELGLTPPTTVSAMDNLEAKGFIQRRRNSEDRRKINIFLTKRGRELQEKLAPYAADVNKIALSDLTAAERKMAFDLLNRMIGALERAPKVEL